MKDISDRPEESLPARRLPAPPLAPAPEPYDDYQDGPPPSTKKVTSRLVFRALRRHWWQALLVWLAGSAGLVALAHNKVKPSYDAVSQVRVELGELPILSQNSAAPIDFLQYMQTQVSRITSPTTIGTALSDKPELTALPILSGKVDPEAEIRQTLRVGVVPKTSLIQVEMSSPVPSEAAKVVNAVVDAYLTLARADYDSSTQTKIDHLKPIREEQRQKVEAYRKDVEKLYKSLGTANLDAIKDRNSISLDTCKQISEQLTHVEIMRIATKARLDQLRNEKGVPIVPTDSKQIEQAMADAFYEDPRVVSVQANIEIAEGKLKEAERLNRLRNDPSVVRQHERLNDLKKKKEDLWARLKNQLRSKVTSAPTDADTEHAIKDAESSYEALKTQEDSLKSRLREAKIENNTAEGEALKLEYARMDLQQEVVVFENINNRLTQLQFNAKNPTARVELEYKAKPSIQPNSDRRTQIMIAAPFIMGLFLMSLLVLMELRGGRVSDPDELTSRMRLQVIGVVPPLPQIRSKSAGANGNGNALSGPPSTQSEFKIQRQLDEYVQSLDHLRVALCAKRDAWGRDRHCVVITSACGSEGKTTLAAQLAERCVNAGMMTLLIDADLRNPTLSRMLDAIENPGLINVLRGELAAEDVITVVGDAGGFHMIPAGTPRVDPSRLLQSERLGHLLAQARESFDMIIVDAPPVLPVPDALIIGRWTDGAVLAVRYDTSRFPLVERANRRLASVGVPVIGAVVNGVRSMESAYGGYYAYGGGYGSSAASGSTSGTPASNSSVLND